MCIQNYPLFNAILHVHPVMDLGGVGGRSVSQNFDNFFITVLVLNYEYSKVIRIHHPKLIKKKYVPPPQV